MAHVDFRAESAQPRGRRVLAQIASADRESEADAQLRDAAHSGAAHSDEVQPPLAIEQSA
jgi:hypothetical protein